MLFVVLFKDILLLEVPAECRARQEGMKVTRQEGWLKGRKAGRAEGVQGRWERGAEGVVATLLSQAVPGRGASWALTIQLLPKSPSGRKGVKVHVPGCQRKEAVAGVGSPA